LSKPKKPGAKKPSDPEHQQQYHSFCQQTLSKQLPCWRNPRQSSCGVDNRCSQPCHQAEAHENERFRRRVLSPDKTIYYNGDERHVGNHEENMSGCEIVELEGHELCDKHRGQEVLDAAAWCVRASESRDCSPEKPRDESVKETVGLNESVRLAGVTRSDAPVKQRPD
jgi:hypothetical protein